ncbi:XRE family transcriptional regulator [Streptomyces celluloflavus]|uniref:XRE family transcriptional regulator n=1 Tax=Streptomyces celluloflavus TaxID=58344 RepID=A0ABW7RQC9_9ACTN
MGVNAALASKMAEHGLTQVELARQLNAAIERLTGMPGDVSDRTVRNLLTGATRRPIKRTRDALEAVFGCSVETLGFTAPSNTAPPEDPVDRRTFISSATGAAAAAATPLLAPNQQRVGVSDVERLAKGLDRLTTLDDQRGGHAALEKAALAGARHALDLQQGSASERVRHRLYGIAADYTSWAAWSCVDAHQLDRAQSHLDRAMTLAGMAQDSTVQFQIWNSIAMLSRQRTRHADAVAAGKAAQALTVSRHDPLFASLARARTAVGLAYQKDKQAALRCLGHAQDYLAKARPEQPRPGWTAFYGPSELLAITAVVQEHLGMPEEAEASSHRALSVIPDRFRRNRGLATTHMAMAQLQQGDLELACVTAATVFDIMKDDEMPGRMRTGLGDFHRHLLDRAPNSVQAREWTDRMRTKWSTQ